MNESRCAYCGAPATTRDHIPPKKLFPKPWPDDLITVPACLKCNNPASKDDEYFIWMMTISAKAVGLEAERARKQRLTPDRERRRRMARRVVDNSGVYDVVTPAGLYLGRSRGYTVDLVRVSRVLERVVRGLYFLERQIPVPAGASVNAFADPPSNSFHQPTIQALLHSSHRASANGAFEYWFSEVADHPDSALLLMRMFSGIFALGFVLGENWEANSAAAAGKPSDA